MSSKYKRSIFENSFIAIDSKLSLAFFDILSDDFSNLIKLSSYLLFISFELKASEIILLI